VVNFKLKLRVILYLWPKPNIKMFGLLCISEYWDEIESVVGCKRILARVFGLNWLFKPIRFEVSGFQRPSCHVFSYYFLI